jgi:flavin reductase
MVNSKNFRDAMSRLASAVNIITSNGPGGLCGCTASAVCSVSDDPPIVLVCINRTSRNNAILKNNLTLCVNVLRKDQQSLAYEFSRSGGEMADRFMNGRWSDKMAPTETTTIGEIYSLPVLDEALVSLQCRITESSEVGSHTVFYCTVDDISMGEPGDPLMYYGREFHGLT